MTPVIHAQKVQSRVTSGSRDLPCEVCLSLLNPDEKRLVEVELFLAKDVSLQGFFLFMLSMVKLGVRVPQAVSFRAVFDKSRTLGLLVYLAAL
jgi:hypothetical protein